MFHVSNSLKLVSRDEKQMSTAIYFRRYKRSLSIEFCKTFSGTINHDPIKKSFSNPKWITCFIFTSIIYFFFLCISFLYIRSLWILHGALTAQSTWVHPNTFHCGLVSRYDVFTRYHLIIPSRVSIDSIGKGVSSFHILCSKLDTVQ